jgi:hypothetical protein
VLSEGYGRVRRGPRAAVLTALAVVGLAGAAVLAGGTGGAAEARFGALPPCGVALPVPGSPGETYEIACNEVPDSPPDNDVPPDFDPDPWPGWPYVPSP